MLNLEQDLDVICVKNVLLTELRGKHEYLGTSKKNQGIKKRIKKR